MSGRILRVGQQPSQKPRTKFRIRLRRVRWREIWHWLRCPWWPNVTIAPHQSCTTHFTCNKCGRKTTKIIECVEVRDDA